MDPLDYRTPQKKSPSAEWAFWKVWLICAGIGLVLFLLLAVFWMWRVATSMPPRP